MITAKKTRTPWNKGLSKSTDSRVAKYSKTISLNMIGRRVIFSEEHRQNLSVSLRNSAKIQSMAGKKIKERGHKIDCRCCFCYKIGKNNPSWKGGKTFIGGFIRKLPQNKNWKISVFVRDKYTCQKCSQVGGKLTAHHRVQFSEILSKFLLIHSQYSPIEDKEILINLAIVHSPFWDVSNGETLCNRCHKRVSKRRTNYDSK